MSILNLIRSRVTHICASKWDYHGSDNGLSPARRQPIIWTYCESVVWEITRVKSITKYHNFYFRNFIGKRRQKWRPFCLCKLTPVSAALDSHVSYKLATMCTALLMATVRFYCVIPLTHWGRDKMAAISQTTLSNAFSWIKMLEFRLGFRWSLFLRVQLIIIQHWFR